MNKILLFFVVISMTLFCNAQNSSDKLISLQEGTLVNIVLQENLDSRVSKVGDLVNLEVVEDVIVDEITIIKKGDKAIGKISQSSPAKWAGKKGELDFTIDFVQTYYGKNIRIRSSNSSDGGSRMAGVIAGAAIVNPLILLVKGKDVTISKGFSFYTYVDKDYEIKLSDINKKKDK